jgi:hypothetical protein
MNNSFPRLIEGMCATLRTEVLPRLDDEFARGQVYGVINLLNTFKVRADWSAGFLLQQVAIQCSALDEVSALMAGHAALAAMPQPSQPSQVLQLAPPQPPPQVLQQPPPLLEPTPDPASVAHLQAQRDAGNQRICDWLAWLDAAAATPNPGTAATADLARATAALRQAMRAEADSELKNSSRPMFAQMSSGRED